MIVMALPIGVWLIEMDMAQGFDRPGLLSSDIMHETFATLLDMNDGLMKPCEDRVSLSHPC